MTSVELLRDMAKANANLDADTGTAILQKRASTCVLALPHRRGALPQPRVYVQTRRRALLDEMCLFDFGRVAAMRRRDTSDHTKGEGESGQ